MVDMVLDTNKATLMKEYAKVTERTEDLICLTMNENPVQYEELTGINIPTVARLGTEGVVYTEIKYRRLTVTNPVKYVADCVVLIDGVLYESFSVRFTAEEDFLGLFTEEVKEETENSEYNARLREFFDMTPQSIAEWIMENEPDVWSKFKSLILENMGRDDVPGNIESDIVDNYLESEPLDAMERAMKYADNDNLRNIAKNIIDEL